MTETIQQLKEDIAVLQEKLQKLEKQQQTKSPVEEAYKDWWGVYPGTEIWTNFDETRWVGFKAGYNAAYEQKVNEEQLATQKGNIKTLVEESVKWCEEHPDKDPLDYLKPQTPEQVADGLKEAFREAVKQGVVSSTKSSTLTDLIYDWSDSVFTTHSELETKTCIENLVDKIELFLPKEQSAEGSQNAYVESAVEGFNDCLNKIKRKLR